jgi:VanZ family protein
MVVDNKRFRIWFILTLLFMAAIYFISDMPYEAQDIKPLLKSKLQMNSTSVLDVEIKYDHQSVSSSNPYDFVEFLFRKAGHIIGYFVLTLLWIKTLSYTNIILRRRLAYSLMLAIGYAALDEFHQTFVPGRSGHLIDVVVVDLLGSVLAVGIVLFTNLVKRKKQTCAEV